MTVSTLIDKDKAAPRGLNESHPKPAYHCGRLVAAMQHVQDVADDRVGATFVARYYTAAAQSPAIVIPRIWNTARHRLRQIPTKKMRDDLEALITRIHNEIEDSLPSRLTLPQQAMFQLGFFHQKALVPRFDSRKRYLTSDGTPVLSDGERFIYNCLTQAKIEFEYERPLSVPKVIGQLETVPIHPDFTVAHNGHCLYIEYQGFRGEDYEKKWRWKQKRYTQGLDGKTLEEIAEEDSTIKVSKHTLMEIRPEDLYSGQSAKRRLLDGVKNWRAAVDRAASPF